MPADPTQARAIARAAALLADRVDRAALLAAVCGADNELRAAVEEHLRIESQTLTLDPPVPGNSTTDLPGQPPFTPPPSTLAGTVLADRYTVLNLLGEGGMGAVYLAEQTRPVRRRVAVKMIKAGGDTARVVARFEAERQALALLDHPHIAKVFDAGLTPWGTPFFVMELADGVPLTEFCDNLRLTIDDRLALFAKVCRAVQHAHQKGIIHRDLKPSNILVSAAEGEPTPKVIDFGLAKAVAPTPLMDDPTVTGHGAMLGTPLYMAPEQAGGERHDVDTRADVYALGVILYELLTGTTPLDHKRFQAAAWSEVVRLVRDEEPPTPSSRVGAAENAPTVAVNRCTEPSKLTRLVRGDLDWVVMKALAKERDRRYDSAAALAEDVSRFLNHEPVSAGSPSRWYKLRKFVRRHRAPVTATALVVVALFAGIIGTTAGLFRALDAELQARAAEGKTAAALTQVSDEQAKTLQAFESERAQRRLTWNTLILVTRSALVPLLERRQSLSAQELAFIKEIQAAFNELAAHPANDPNQSLDIAETGRCYLGVIHLKLGEWKEAEVDLREGIRLNEQIAGDRTGLLADAYHNLSFALVSQGRYEDAIASSEREIELREKALTTADSPGARIALAAARGGCAVDLYQAGHYLEAVATGQAAVADCERLASDRPDDPAILNRLAYERSNLGFFLLELGRTDEARPHLERAVTQLRARHGTHPDDAECTFDLAIAVDRLADCSPDPPDVLRREAEALIRPLHQAYPANVHYAVALGRMLFARGVADSGLGRDAAARDTLREAKALFKGLRERDPESPESRHHLAGTQMLLGLCLRKLGAATEGEAEVREAVREYEAICALKEVPPKQHFGHANAHMIYGVFLENRGRPADGLAELDKAAAALEPLRKEPTYTALFKSTTESILDKRSACLVQLGRHADAVNAFDELIPLVKPEERRGLALKRFNSLVRVAPPDRVMNELDAFLADKQVTPREHFLAAGAVGLAVEKVTDPVVREKLQKRSIGLVHRAWQLGYDSPALHEGVKALRAMKDVPEVAAFLAEYDRPRETGPPPRLVK